MYEHFISHAQNKGRGGPAIRAALGARNWPDKDIADKWLILKAFLNPKDIARAYPSRDDLEQTLQKRFEQEFGQKSFNKTVKNYITTMYQLARWFSQFDDGEAAYTYFDKYYKPNAEDLFRHLRSRKDEGNGQDVFFGMNALLRDALKELGYEKFVKPDVHVKDIAIGTEIVETDASPDNIAQTVQGVAERGGWTPYRLDKLFYLIGSGAFLAEGHENVVEYFQKRDPIARKEGFIDYVKERLDSPPLSNGRDVALLRSQKSLVRGALGKVVSVDKAWLVTVGFKVGSEDVKCNIYISDLLVLHE